MLQQVGWYEQAAQMADGSNQVVCNWIDHVAINISANPKVTTDNSMQWNNCTGDMWIDDPTNNPLGNKYENLQGVWHVANGATPVRNPKSSISAMSGFGASVDFRAQDRAFVVQVANSATARVEVVDVHGRTIRHAEVHGFASLFAAALTPGAYIVRVKQRSFEIAESVMVR